MSLPNAPEAEKAFLASCMVDSRILNEASDLIKPKMFFNPSHNRIFDAIMDLWKEGKDIDLITLTDHMDGTGTLELSGGAAYVSEIFLSLPTSSNWREYLSIIKEKYSARLYIQVAERIIASAKDPVHNPDLSEEVQKALVMVAAEAETASSIQSIKEIAINRVEEYEEMVRNRGKLIGITTGFAPLDAVTGGFRKGQLIVIGAPTKGGKTALALNMGMRAAQDGHSVGIISLEMSSGELVDRLIASITSADISRLSKEKEVCQKLMAQIRQGVENIAGLPIYVRDESSLNCLQLRAAARRLVAVHGIRLMIVDYIQLLEPTNRTDSRERQVAECSRTLKSLTKELGITIIALTQLNADGASRESRAIEHDADLFLTISQDEQQPQNWFLNIKLARACPRTSVPLSFRSEYLRFEDR